MQGRDHVARTLFDRTRSSLDRAPASSEKQSRTVAALELMELVWFELEARRPQARALSQASDSTEQDHFVQGVILGFLQAHPATRHDGVHGEELKSGGVDRPGIVWFADPIDSTAGYVSGDVDWGSSVICVDASGNPLCSVFILPDQGKLYAAAGKHVWLNGESFARKYTPSRLWVSRAPRGRAPGDPYFDLCERTRTEALTRELQYQPGRDFTALDMLSVATPRGPDLFAYFGAKPHDALAACYLAETTGGACARVLSEAQTVALRDAPLDELRRAATPLFPLGRDTLQAAVAQARMTLFVERIELA